MATDEVTSKGKAHIDRWRAALSSLESAKSGLNRAECEVANATNALGKWLLPDDAKHGEQFCVWHGDSLIAATKVGDHDYAVTVRSRGRSLSAA